MPRFRTCLIAVVLLGMSSAGFAQTPAMQPPVSKPVVAPGEQIPLKVLLVVSRYAGDKKVSSTPYTISVVANDNDRTTLRMGVDVAVPQSVIKAGEVAGMPVTTYNYRSIGTKIDCGARTIEGGVFKLDLAVEDSSVFLPNKQGGTLSTVEGTPAFRSFTSTFNVLLRDGQTAQHTSATDPVSGEVLRVDVTLTVLK